MIMHLLQIALYRNSAIVVGRSMTFAKGHQGVIVVTYTLDGGMVIVSPAAELLVTPFSALVVFFTVKAETVVTMAATATTSLYCQSVMERNCVLMAFGSGNRCHMHEVSSMRSP